MNTHFNFAFVSNSEAIAQTVHGFASAQGIRITVRLASMEDALPVAKELLDTGTDVILSGGGTGKLLRQKLKRPVVTISRTHLDILRTLLTARRYSNYIALTSYGEMTEGLDVFADLLRVRLRPVVFASSPELTEGIAKAVDDGVGCVVGGGVCADIAGGLGCKGFVVVPGPRVIQRALEEAVNIAESQRKDRQHAAWLEGALESLHEGVIGVDKKGEIFVSNSKAENFLCASSKNRPEVFNNFLRCAGINKTLANGLPVPDKIVAFGGRSIVTNIRPIHMHDDVEGALASFRPASYLRGLSGKLNRHDTGRGFTAKYDFTDLAGSSRVMRELRRKAERFARTDASINIQGETGTGKELLAHAIHAHSSRSKAPFVAVNCAALPETLLESELFGYEEGAFTGARKGGKEGLFLLADGGTIFLDEIADISPLLQVRLLRVLEAQEILQVGGRRVIPISVRVLTSSWKNLAEEVRAGRFRADLYYRLNTLPLRLPPLRERAEDVPVICAVLLRRAGLSPDIFSPAAYELLSSYAWPGNVRELDALVRRYALLIEGDKPDDALLAELLGELEETSGAPRICEERETVPDDGLPLKQQVERYERRIIRQALSGNGKNKKKVALQLGISENTLWRKLKGE